MKMINKERFFIILDKSMDEKDINAIEYLAKVNYGVEKEEDKPCFATIKMYQPISITCNKNMIGDTDFLVLVNIKWDGCTHWNFFGEDYNEFTKDVNAYYHLCGQDDFLSFIYGMINCVSIAKLVMGNNFDEDFFGDEYIVLEDICKAKFNIKEVSKEEIDSYCDIC